MSGRILALVALLGGIQDERDSDPAKLPPEAEKHYRFALYEPAEKAMRELQRLAPTDENRTGLLQVLLRARKYDGLKVEAEFSLRTSTSASMKALAHAMTAMAAWKTGDAAAAEASCAAALQLADAHAANAFPAVRRLVRTIRAYAAWKRHESKTHVIYYPADSPVAPSVADLGRKLDTTFESIRAALDVAFDGPVEAYVYNDQVQADRIIGWPLNFALPRDRAYHVLHDGAFGFEMAHVVSFYATNRKEKERPRSALVTRGFAAAWAQDAVLDRRIAEIPLELLRRERSGGAAIPSLVALDDSPGEGTEAIATSGSFVGWLVRTRGREKFARLWGGYNDSKEPWREVYETSLAELEKEWRSSIK